ncbi:hypothetical protein [Thalassococcus lentus]|uniref:Dihydrodipicolinate reductase n=1 Tax=Thalassococcus lentus TaxID=1210524 RepID=A0ABT4XT56_9RHOB|nr:hypothetical protein [Thalassococcus lentus]MDA7425116.1 hypothetical protein [Thalassococcus lentus]
MKPLSILAILTSLAAGPVASQAFGLKEGDARFDRSVLLDRLSGQVVTFYDNGQSEYFTDGRYTYTYANQGGTAYGYWEVAADGSVCIDFVNGFSRCDLYVMNAGRMILLDEKGDRYPVRPQQ